MSLVVRKAKVAGVYVLYDDDEDKVVSRFRLDALQNEQAMLASEITRLDIVNRPAKLQAWAQQYYPISPEGQTLDQDKKRKAQVDSLIQQAQALG